MFILWYCYQEFVILIKILLNTNWQQIINISLLKEIP